jgi:hypothetical protein
VLAHGGATPDAIVQLGGSADTADAAVRCDALACSAVMQLALDHNVPLTFVTTDTGASPFLRWLCDYRQGEPLQRLEAPAPGIDLKQQLRQFPRVLQLVVECVQADVSPGLPTSFEDASYLHAPLVLLHALAPFSGFSPLPVVAARVTCDSLIPSSICAHMREMQWCNECWGRWTVFVDTAAAECAADAAWWLHPRMYSARLRDAAASGGDPNNCSLTVGWVSEELSARFRTALLQLLSTQPPL